MISPIGTRKFLPFLNTVAEDFVDFMHRQVRKNTRRSLTVDLYHDLFRFTLEGTCCPQVEPSPVPPQQRQPIQTSPSCSSGSSVLWRSR